MAFLGIKHKGIQISTNLGQDGVIPQAPGGGGSYEPEAAAYFSAVEAVGDPIPTYIKTGFNNLVLREKLNNRFTKLRRAYPYLGARVNSAKIDAISLDRAIPINLQDSDIGTNVGLTTDGISSALVDSTNAAELLTDPLTMSWGAFAKGSPVNFNGFANGTWDSRSSPTFITTRMNRRVYAGKTTVYAPLTYYADNNASFIGAKYGATPIKAYMKNDLYDDQGASGTATSFNVIKPDAQWVVCGATWQMTGTEPNLIYFNGQTNLFDFLAFGFTEEELLGFRESVFLYLNEINAYA